MNNKKGQAAMEFLMTYGWAILAAIVAIGVLAYFYFVPSTIPIEDEITNEDLDLINNLVAIFDSGIRAITWDYNYGGKEWKYFTMMNATCREVTCPCVEWGCMAYCIECTDEIRNSDVSRSLEVDDGE